MKTIILKEPGQFSLTNSSDIQEIGNDEVLVKIKRIGICGTDYHAFRGNQPFFTYPRVLGHELGGEIVGIGNGHNPKLLKIGDSVSIEPYLHCHTCQACKRGLTNCCENLQVLGVHVDGGMAEYLKIPKEKVHVSSKLSFEQLAMVETLGIGSHAVTRASLKYDDIVLIIGAGPIGLATAQFAKLTGAKVIMADFNEKRLTFSITNKLVDEVIVLSQPVTAEQMREQLLGNLPTAIFDATGNKTSMENCFNFAAQGAKIIFIGLFQGEVSFNDPNFHKREISLFSSRNALPSDFTKIISLMESGEINTKPWISHRASFDTLPQVFSSWLEPEQEVIKALVHLD